MEEWGARAIRRSRGRRRADAMLAVGGATVFVAATMGRVARLTGDTLLYASLALGLSGLALLLAGALLRWRARAR